MRFDAHRLLHLAAARGRQDAAVERFFRAHFTELRSLFDADSLVELAGVAGAQPVEVFAQALARAWTDREAAPLS